MIKVSVVIPIYNVEKYLRECLDSVIGQTLQEIEIICINDGSTDGCGSILEEYRLRDPRIKVIHKKNTGYGNSVNIGINEAQGIFVDIVESDDYIESDMLERFWELANDKILDVVKADSKYFVDDKNASGDTSRKFFYRNCINSEKRLEYDVIYNSHKTTDTLGGYVYTWAGMYRKSFLDKYKIRHNETPGASFQDNGFWFQTTMYAERIMFINESFYNLRRDNLESSFYRKDKLSRIIDEYDYIERKVETSNHVLKQELLKKVYYYKILNYCSLSSNEDKNILNIWSRFQNDLKCASSLGVLVSTDYNMRTWCYIYDIFCGKFYPYSYSLLTEGIREKIVNASKIAIYGAGKRGKKVKMLLDDLCLSDKFAGFIVSRSEDAEGDLIRCIDDVTYDDTLVVVAVGYKLIPDIVSALTSRGVNNYVIEKDMYRNF